MNHATARVCLAAQRNATVRTFAVKSAPAQPMPLARHENPTSGGLAEVRSPAIASSNEAIIAAPVERTIRGHYLRSIQSKRQGTRAARATLCHGRFDAERRCTIAEGNSVRRSDYHLRTVLRITCPYRLVGLARRFYLPESIRRWAR